MNPLIIWCGTSVLKLTSPLSGYIPCHSEFQVHFYLLLKSWVAPSPVLTLREFWLTTIFVDCTSLFIAQRKCKNVGGRLKDWPGQFPFADTETAGLVLTVDFTRDKP